jgi:GNAT superfamily N-acetyltransferase
MTIQYHEECPTRDQFWRLFQTTGWNETYQFTPEVLIKVAENSWYVVTAYDGEQLVGFGRVVTDTISHAMIYDLITIPDYQGQGIASRILDMIIAKCRAANIRDIQLFSAKGKRPFYEKRGFTARPDDAPGMYLNLT